MGLTCEGGNASYAEIFKELIFKLHFDQRDIYLLDGPVDILLQFTKLKSLQQFMNRCFNPVRMIGTDENLIRKIVSFIVISPSPIPAEKPFAFAFINTQPKKLETVRKGLLNLPQVLSADSVFGPYGVISSIKARGNAEYERAVSSMENFPGVEDLATSTVNPTDLFPDW